jgi:signal transduction histidine kinase
MIDNIVGNAIKANATKLRIVVDDTLNGYHIVKFIDNGDGINKSIQDIDRLFEFGVTTTNGSGLGLFYAKKYMDDIKGKIEMVSNEDQGVSIILKFKKQKNEG